MTLEKLQVLCSPSCCRPHWVFWARGKGTESFPLVLWCGWSWAEALRCCWTDPQELRRDDDCCTQLCSASVRNNLTQIHVIKWQWFATFFFNAIANRVTWFKIPAIFGYKFGKYFKLIPFFSFNNDLISGLVLDHSPKCIETCPSILKGAYLFLQLRYLFVIISLIALKVKL